MDTVGQDTPSVGKRIYVLPVQSTAGFSCMQRDETFAGDQLAGREGVVTDFRKGILWGASTHTVRFDSGGTEALVLRCHNNGGREFRFLDSRPEEEGLGKCGKLWKQGRGGAFGRANWKEREFVLTASLKRLSYFEGENQKGCLDFEGQTSRVERLLDSEQSGEGGPTEWRFAATCGERTLNMAAATETEMHEWIDAIRNVLG
jgi:hypothetical protein